MTANFPYDFKTIQIYQMPANFRSLSKLSGIFQMTANFPDNFKSVQSLWLFSFPRPLLQANNNNLNSIFIIPSFLCTTCFHPLALIIDCLDFPDDCQFSGLFQNSPKKIARTIGSFGPKSPFSYISALFGPFYDLFGLFLTLFNAQTPLLAL